MIQFNQNQDEYIEYSEYVQYMNSLSLPMDSSVGVGISYENDDFILIPQMNSSVDDCVKNYDSIVLLFPQTFNELLIEPCKDIFFFSHAEPRVMKKQEGKPQSLLCNEKINIKKEMKTLESVVKTFESVESNINYILDETPELDSSHFMSDGFFQISTNRWFPLGYDRFDLIEPLETSITVGKNPITQSSKFHGNSNAVRRRSEKERLKKFRCITKKLNKRRGIYTFECGKIVTSLKAAMKHIREMEC